LNALRAEFIEKPKLSLLIRGGGNMVEEASEGGIGEIGAIKD